MNAYHGLLDDHHVPESFALEAACLVYKHHHPEDGVDIARLKVESWIHAGHLH